MSLTLDTIQAIGKGSFNLSLLKINKITQVVIGIIITAVLLVATAATVFVVVVRTQPSAPIVGDYYDTANKQEIRKLYLLDVCEDPRQDQMFIRNITKPVDHGRLEISEDKLTVLFYAPESFSGNVTFVFEISNSQAQTKGNGTILVLNRPPITPNIVRSVPNGDEPQDIDIFNSLDGDKVVTDYDEGDLPFLRIVSISKPSDGNITFDGKKISFTPVKDLVENITVQYEVTDGYDTSRGDLTIMMRYFPPQAVEDRYTISYNKEAILDVLKNDWDPQGSPLRVVRVNYFNSEGAVSIVEGGTKLMITPPFNFREGIIYFEYIINNKAGLSSIAPVYINFKNDPPYQNSSLEEIPMNSPPTIFGLVYDDPNEGSTLFVELKKR